MVKILLKMLFDVDYGIVETVAHFTAAKSFMPDVEFVIDIGGQDIKCFKVHNGAIDNIFLNEACSSVAVHSYRHLQMLLVTQFRLCSARYLW